MTRGTIFLKSSKFACGKIGITKGPYGHMSGTGRLYLKGHCGYKKNQKLTVYSSTIRNGRRTNQKILPGSS